PSYRVTRDEEHLTRGRANTLRLALTGQLGPDAMAGDEVAEAMHLCVSCKACRRECPTGVDVAKMKIEVLAARADRHGVGAREKLIAALPRLGPVASRLPWLANLRNRSPLLRRAGERIGIAAARPLPEWSSRAFRDGEAPAGGEVLLLADSFNRYFEPENLRAALRVLGAAGIAAGVPRGGSRPLCCGRTYLAAGMVEQARAEASRLLDALEGDAPVLGLEPSCLFTLKDELPALLPGPRARALADRAMLLGEYLAKRKPPLPFHALETAAHVHGHCHQKSFGAFPAGIAALKAVPGLEVKPIASSCCGMAGAFGYGAETQEVSRAMAEASLLPAVRAAGAADLIVADGTSCRHQIRDLSGRTAIHSVRVMEMAL
ncbi:MAG TPA: heterodisulfide reductase-related iron-sulfur binding cluster, partial [Acetobacteraceae bacterium]